MPLTPIDIQNKEFSRSIRGLSPVEVDEFMDRVEVAQILGESKKGRIQLLLKKRVS